MEDMQHKKAAAIIARKFEAIDQAIAREQVLRVKLDNRLTKLLAKRAKTNKVFELELNLAELKNLVKKDHEALDGAKYDLGCVRYEANSAIVRQEARLKRIEELFTKMCICQIVFALASILAFLSIILRAR